MSNRDGATTNTKGEGMHNIPTVISETSVTIANLIDKSDTFVASAEFFRFKFTYMVVLVVILIFLWFVQYVWRRKRWNGKMIDKFEKMGIM